MAPEGEAGPDAKPKPGERTDIAIMKACLDEAEEHFCEYSKDAQMRIALALFDHRVGAATSAAIMGHMPDILINAADRAHEVREERQRRRGLG